GCKNDNCLEDGDKVCDTPPDASTARVACGDDFNSCNTDANSGFSTDQNDMYWNYMDYGDFNCYSAFTEGQRNRMIFSIENIRASLLQSKACIPNCDENIIVDFDIAKDTFKLGETVNLTNTSSSNTTTFSWEIDGEEKSTAKNFTYQFSEEGYHFIKLIGYNSDMSCFDFKLIRIFAECPAKVELNTTSNLALLGESVHFEANAEVSNTFDWYIDGNFKATGQQFDYIFQNEGTHTVKVISQNNQWNCSDTASTNIMVSCPVKAEFKTDAFFPEINSIVHFTNTSINAITYQWEINDQIISNNKDLNYTFDLPGEYSVCLTAENDDCSKDFCMQIFVLDTGQLNCEDVYYKRIGDPNVNEQGYDFDFIDDNTIAVVGSYDNESLIFKINEKTQVISSEKLNFLSNDEYIYNSFIDNDGFLILSGVEFNVSNGRSAFIAKYDSQNKNFIWKKKIEDTKVNYPIFWTLSQLKNGNYLIGGKTYVKNNNCDALVMELENNTGDIIWHKTFDA
ncbi:MAG TPA: PKD domain-containing protein, partial [Bacteroidetes bacterium]|nr:PKD domain-containing protein [Bacteroidota bacterium]